MPNDHEPPSLPPPIVCAANPIGRCAHCAQGILGREKAPRFGAFGLAVGCIILISCFLLFVLGAVGLYGAKKVDSRASALVDGSAREKLEARGIPEPIIAKVLANEWLNDDDLSKLTHDQEAAVDRYKTSVSLAKSGAGLGSFLAGGVSVVLMGMSLFRALIGWILTLRKEILRCGQCSALAAPP